MLSKKIGVVLSGCGVFDGAEIHEAVLTLLSVQQNGAEALLAQNKPIGFICITPALGAKLIPGATLTFGEACDASGAIQQMGATHVVTDVGSITIDEENNVVSTGAYMVGPWVADVWKGIDALVTEVIRRA
jgi:enhancing lycopene biosynthesis protein 2